MSDEESTDPAVQPPPPPPPAQDPDQTVGIVVLILGILGLWLCQILGPVALILGFVTLRKAQAEGRQLNVLAIIGTALGAVATLILVMTVLMMVGICCLYVVIFGFAFIAALAGA